MFVSMNLPHGERGFIFYKQVLDSISKYWTPNEKVQKYYKTIFVFLP